MTTITTRSGKGSPLTNNEVDANFTNLNDDKVEASGDSMTGNLSFGDNNKAIFGAGSDLQIYHDGSNSYITDSGTGNLNILANEFAVYEGNGTDLMIGATPNGAVTLSHNATTKLATTSTGIDVTGTVTADDSITLAATPTSLDENRLIFNETPAAGSLGSRILWRNPSTGYDYASVGFTNEAGSSGGLRFKTASSVFSDSDALRMKIADNGDISFYEDTGTTAKLFWDASTERLGLNTTTPEAGIQVAVGSSTIPSAGSSGSSAVFGNATSGSAYGLALGANSSGVGYISAQRTDGTATTYNLAIQPNGGNVGIGTSSPQSSQKLHIANTSGHCEMTLQSGDSSTAAILFGDATDFSRGKIAYTNSNDAMVFQVNNLQEAMRIDSSGNVGIGTSSPQRQLHVSKNANNTHIAIERDGADNPSALILGANQNKTEIISSAAEESTSGVPLTFLTGNTERMRIDASGNVGIGTSSVDTTLHLSAGDIGPVLRLECTDTALVTDQGVGVIEFEHNDASGVPGVPVKIGAYAENNHGSVGLRFYTGVGNTANEVVRFDHDGNVGIGTSSPSAQLHALSTMQVGAGTNFGNRFTIYDSLASGTTPFVIRDSANGDDIFTISANSTSGEVKLDAADDQGVGYFAFTTNNTERMRIDASGNVGIGTTTAGTLHSSNYGTTKLHIDGGSGRGQVILEGDTNANLVMSDNGATANSRVFITQVTDGLLKFRSVNDNGTSKADIMSLTSAGNVGIGTSSPAAKLHVYQSANNIIQVGSAGTSTAGIDLAGDGATAGTDSYRLYQDSGKTTYVWNYANTPLRIGTNNTERMRIDASGNVQVATGNVFLQGNGSQLTTTYSGITTSRFYTSTSGLNLAVDGAWPLMFSNNSAERMRIDSNGQVNIGTTGYGTYSSGDRVLSLGSGTTIRGAASGAPYLTAVSNGYFDGTNWKYAQTHPASNYEQYNGNHTFSYAASGTAGNNITFNEAMRIDASGNLLVGTTNVNPVANNVTGTAVYANGTLLVSREGSSAAFFNRKGSDGNIIDFRKDGTTSVGSIAYQSHGLQVNGETDHSGISFDAFAHVPLRNATRADNTVSLGTSSYRFKDLYLSSGVYLGGTGSANKLDDYEEGTWTPTVTGTASNPTVSYAYAQGTYTKVGDVVTVFCYIALASISGGTGNATISGLPFTMSTSNNSHLANGPLLLDALGGDAKQVSTQGNGTTGITLIQGGGSTGTHTGIAPTSLGNTSAIRFFYTYKVA